jgi:hypothetical protein
MPPAWGLAGSERHLPDFTLDSIGAAGVVESMGGAQFPVPEPPVPVPEKTDAQSGSFEAYPLYDARRTGRVRLTGMIKFTVDGKKSKAEVRFPEVGFENARAGDRSFFFIRVAGEASSPALSWAAII